MRVWVGEAPHTPLGKIWVAVTSRGLVAVEIGAPGQAFHRRTGRSPQPDLAATARFLGQIDAYLRGERRQFDLPLDWSGMPPFQVRALQAACRIPYGQVATYGQIAHQIGSPRGARAVGRAMATNPMPLVLPCHRLIGADGGLHGYGGAGGLQTKAWLQALERSNLGAGRAPRPPEAFL